MEEKLILLMEETGCAQGEAQLALELANDDFEKAIHIIKGILRNIVVIKGRFFSPDDNIYGLFVAILDKRAEILIRLTGVVSYNPIIYEVDLNSDWNLFEKNIFNFRLMEGSVPGLTRETELRLVNGFAEKKDKFYKALTDLDKNKICDILTSDLTIKNISLEISIEEINLAQYQQVDDKQEVESKSEIRKISSEKEPRRLFIESTLQENEDGKKAKHLLEDEVVMAQITDDREIAKYLARLITDKDSEYIPVKIEKTEYKNKEIYVRLCISSGIAGIVKLKPNTKVTVMNEISKPLWKKIFNFR
ncbi:MAG: hypothetical protein A2252_01395 [Elusimicrobia bacterium RIFOXYA2_FULL_39_19]|nr:MAG: hypothetical protein A2252_01395 [Elusimicrobia bacterium RIFOXYA2_FULL_39_19]